VRGNLRVRQSPPLSFWQGTETHIADSYPLKGEHTVTNLFEHAADLAVTPFVEHDAQAGSVTATLYHLDPGARSLLS
jgi:hypothetical protein